MTRPSRRGIWRQRLACFGSIGVASASAAAVPIETVTIVHQYPHAADAYTEGLSFDDGTLIESTGIEGKSLINRTRLSDGKLLHSVKLPPEMFGEGSVAWQGEIVSLTWQNGVGFRWRATDFKPISRFSYSGEGWGLTQDGRNLVMSDGTAVLRFLDPVTFAERRRIEVRADGKPVLNLNELEWVNGEILANLWLTDRIARIDPRTGKVKAWIDLSPLVAAAGRSDANDVANGIAYDRAHDRLIVTGKRWPYLYEIRLKPASPPR